MKEPLRFKDGSVVYQSMNWKDKWIALTTKGDVVRDENNRMRYFDSSEEAVAALKEMGQAE